MGTHKAALPWSVGRVSGEEGGRLTVRYHRILTAAHHIVGGMEKGVGGRESGIDLLFVLFYSLVFVSPFFFLLLYSCPWVGNPPGWLVYQSTTSTAVKTTTALYIHHCMPFQI